mmetsp:Transcript_15413/g.19813  ORF Transcript_15413/g.19813 Transcript_15413/m.19813 type:complete len:151 (+) Transcript_15413:335-787(+)
MQELKRPSPAGWSTNTTNWKISHTKSIFFAGGGRHGPSSSALTACKNRSLSELFLYFQPVKVLEDIAKQTNKYGNEDWVNFASVTSECTSEAEYDSEHEHENVVHRRPLLPCNKKDKDKRHRFQHTSSRGEMLPWDIFGVCRSDNFCRWN